MLWSTSINSISKKFQSFSNNCEKLIIANDQLVQNFSQILCIHIKTNSQIPDSLLSTSGFKKFDFSLNKIKENLLNIFNITIGVFHVEDQNPPSDRFNLQNTMFFKNIDKIGLICLKTLFTFCKNIDTTTCFQVLLKNKFLFIFLTKKN